MFMSSPPNKKQLDLVKPIAAAALLSMGRAKREIQTQDSKAENQGKKLSETKKKHPITGTLQIVQ